MDDESLPGIYRGTVFDNRDPEGRHRLLVVVPAVNGTGELAEWALPCVPFGATTRLPLQGESVWVMFENGDPDAPVWLGTWRVERQS